MPTEKPGRLRRWASLFGFGSVPGGAEETRAFLQRRMSLFFGVMAGIAAIFYVVSFTMTLFWFRPYLAGWFIETTRLVHLAATLFNLGCWYYTSPRFSRSLTTLGTLDAVGSVILMALIAGMLAGVPAVMRPDIEFMLILNVTLVARAAIVPSTPARTLFVGVFGALLITSLSTYIHVRDIALTSALRVPMPVHYASTMLIPPPTVIAILCLTWSAVSVTLTTLISRVIYGLHKKIEEVAQLGQYRLDEKIGEGGMGMVFRASHAMLRRPTAIKLLPPERMGTSALHRFEREVQNTAKLTHPNTVAIYDYGRTPEGLFYYAMEYLEGLDLEKLVALDGAQPQERVLHVLRQVTGALAEAHDAGLIHRDIKPANVILCKRGGVADFAKVVDFGLVKEISGGTATSTGAGNIITGTPLYMSPESFVSPDRVDGRSDLYALGAVAYYLLTGAPVFDAPTLLEVCARHLHAEVIPPSKRTSQPIDPRFEDLILSCLEKLPENRPRNAGVLLEAMTSLEVAAWSPRDAQAWWTAHEEEVRARRSETRATSPFGKTVGIDLGRRGAAA